MRSSSARRALVVALVAIAAITSYVVTPGPSPHLQIPAAQQLIAGTGWRIDRVYEPKLGYVYLQQWLLTDARGDGAQLYVGVTYRLTSALRWTGESGYEGEGYLLTAKHKRNIRLGDGTEVTVDAADVERWDDHQTLAYALVGPTGVSAPSEESLPFMLFALATTRGSPYYVVRVSVHAPQPADSGDSLLAAVLTRLRMAD